MWNKITWDNLQIEIVGGIILSIFGLFLIWFLRPKVKISDEICCEEDPNTGIKTFKIKVINRSYLFRLIDLNFELTMLEPVQSPSGTNLKIKTIQLKSNKVWYLSRRKIPLKFFKKNDYASYAIIVNVDQSDTHWITNWANSNSIFFDFKVIAKNNFSGITSINHKKFNHFSDIIKGKFHHGDTMKIKNI
jgi:hypothetical protein